MQVQRWYWWGTVLGHAELIRTVQLVNMLYGLIPQDLAAKSLYPLKLSSTSLWLRHWASHPLILLAP